MLLHTQNSDNTIQAGAAILFLAILGAVMWSSPVHAGAVLDKSLYEFKSTTAAFGKQVQPVAMHLLWYLATLQLVVNLMFVTLRQIDFNELIATFVRSLFSIGIFIFLIQSASWLLPSIIDSFTELGKMGSGLSELTPSVLIKKYITLESDIMARFKAETGATNTLLLVIKNPFPSLALSFASILLLLSGAVLAFQMFLIQFSAYMYLALAPVLFGFGGLSQTQDIALNALKGGLIIGIRIIVVYLMAKIANDLTQPWADNMAHFKADDWDPLWDAVLGSFLLAFMAFKLPDVAVEALLGQAALTMGGLGTTLSTGASIISAGANIARLAMKTMFPLTKAALPLAKAAKAGLASMGPLLKAGRNALFPAAPTPARPATTSKSTAASAKKSSPARSTKPPTKKRAAPKRKRATSAQDQQAQPSGHCCFAEMFKAMQAQRVAPPTLPTAQPGVIENTSRLSDISVQTPQDTSPPATAPKRQASKKTALKKLPAANPVPPAANAKKQRRTDNKNESST
jgi:P-type conjugative transfer protein TrbL